MKKHFKKAIAGVLAVSMTVSSFLVPMATERVQATEITDAEIAADLASFDNVSSAEIAEVMSPGWNLGNTMEANGAKKIDGKWYTFPNETAWSNPKVTKEIFEAVKAAGFKSVRIPVSYLDYVGDAESGYRIDEKWLGRVEEVVRMALDTGLYVNINVHGDGYYTVGGSWLLCGESTDKQVEIKKKYEAVWKQIATRFADCDEHLIFESMNEEFDGVHGVPDDSTYKETLEAYSNIVAYNQIFVDTVRQCGENNAKRWLMVCGWNTNIDATCSDKYGFEMPTDTYRDASISSDEWRIMVSCHYYSPWQFCGQEDGDYTQWGKYAVDSSKVWPGANEDYIASQFKLLQDTFTSKGIPVYIGEYGAIDKTADDPLSDAYRSYFMKTLCQLCKETGCVPVYWDQGYNGNYAFYLFDRNTCEITKPALVNAIMDVYDGDDSEKTAEDITNVYVSKASEMLYLGDKDFAGLQLATVFDPIEVKDTVKWASTDESVATVTAEGLVMPVGKGICKITATSTNGTVGSCNIEVVQGTTSITLNYSELKLDMDSRETKQMEATLQPADAQDSIIWSSSNANVAKVDKAGLVTAVSTGECIITATTGNGLTAECKVTVYSASTKPEENQPMELKDGDTVKVAGQTYVVTNMMHATVAYKAAKSKSMDFVEVPATISVEGKTYKVTSIASNAFKGNRKLKNVIIGTNVKTIGKNAFSNCVALKKITVKSKELTSVGKKALQKINAKCKIIVPKSMYSKYVKLFRGKGQKKTVKIIAK